jgi:hypothetical protein
MNERPGIVAGAIGVFWLSLMPVAAAGVESPDDLASAYALEVDRRLQVPAVEQAFYAGMLEAALRDARIVPSESQTVVLVDRNPNVQAVLLYWRPSTGSAVFIGASPASTGRPGGFEHYETPTGVFTHSVDNPDFRAEGTENENGVCGYGAKGMRVFDFGWVLARRTWGSPGESAMRLQMHATDARLLEPRLGTAQSEGCIRIPGSLNVFVDRYGILDGDYEQAMATGRRFWVMRSDRTPTPWSGRYLVIVDSGRSTRPTWSPLPRRR